MALCHQISLKSNIFSAQALSGCRYTAVGEVTLTAAQVLYEEFGFKFCFGKVF